MTEIGEIPIFTDGTAKNVVGIDLGMNFLATAVDTSGKTPFFNGRSVKNKKANYVRL